MLRSVATRTCLQGYVRLPTNNYTALMNAVVNVGPIGKHPGTALGCFRPTWNGCNGFVLSAAISAAAEPWQLYESGVYHGNCGAGTPICAPITSHRPGAAAAHRECHVFFVPTFVW